MTKPGDLLTLLLSFGALSLFAVGGAVSAIPEMHRIAVDTHQWMTEQQFTDSFAISQLSPGPNILIVTLIGYRAAGIPGALVATFAMCIPAAIMAGIVGRTFERAQDAVWALVVSAALVPVSIGLMSASGFVLALSLGTSWMAWLTLIGAGVGVLTTKISPIWFLVAGGLVGASGLI
jgi:chromate transporter